MKSICNLCHVFFCFITIALITFSYPAQCQSSNKVPSNRSILEKADMLRNNSEHRKALDLYKEIASTYRADMSKEEKLLCLEAIYGCIDDSMALSNYADVARYIALAEEIRDSENITDDRLEIFYSCAYIVMGTESGNNKMLAKGYPHALKAFDCAVKASERRKMELSFFHIIDYFRTLRLPGMQEKVDSLTRIFKDNIKNSCSSEIFTRYYQAVKEEYINKDYRAAALQYDSILSVIPEDKRNARKRATFLIYAAEARAKNGDSTRAVAGLHRAIALADSMKQTEYKVTAYLNLHSIYEMLGDSAKANLYKKMQETLQDSISSFAIADDIYVLDHIKEEKELHRQIALARYRSKVMQWVILFASIILLIVVVFLLLLRCKNAGLTERARILRQLLREHTSQKAQEKTATKSKYEGSSLSEDEKNSIAASIREVLDSDDVFSSDFSLGSLSEKIGKSTKAVSQVINELFNTNFSTVVNRTRIYEVCRRLDSPEYENWSVEGIAESVGYTQRNTFSTNFKKFTGMGIREYRKLSEEERKNINNY